MAENDELKRIILYDICRMQNIDQCWKELVDLGLVVDEAFDNSVHSKNN